jgi:hypothetical protein
MEDQERAASAAVAAAPRVTARVDEPVRSAGSDGRGRLAPERGRSSDQTDRERGYDGHSPHELLLLVDA